MQKRTCLMANGQPSSMGADENSSMDVGHRGLGLVTRACGR
jgi:hypothetical protein